MSANVDNIVTRDIYRNLSLANYWSNILKGTYPLGPLGLGSTQVLVKQQFWIAKSNFSPFIIENLPIILITSTGK